jgi:adenylate cyclase
LQFFFGDHVLDVDRRELRRAGTLIPVEPQVFDLIAYLVRNRERVVSKDDLIEGVWGGRIVSESTLTSRINAARKAIGDNGREQRLIRTAARKGLRFVGEVRERAQTPAADLIPADAFPADGYDAAPHPPKITDRPSIAVLPFINFSDDPELELMVTGLAEDIITLLARVPGFFVISRASSFFYARKPVEIRQVGAELGVRYIVTGSARGFATRVRIGVQFIDAESGTQLWANRYEVERGDTLDLQDEIARRVITELEPALTKAELLVIRRRRTQSVDAWAHYRHAAGAIAVHGWNDESVTNAQRLLREAIRIDPNFALAHALLALISAFGANLSLVEDRDAAAKDARDFAERAVALDSNASDVLGFAGCALADIGDAERGYELLRRALELDPSNAQAHVAIGATLVRLKRFDEGISSMQFGMRSSPKDFRLTFWSMILADGLVRAGRLQEAVEVASAAARRDSRLYGVRVVMAWSLMRLNRADEARAALADARRIRPALNLDEIRRFFGHSAATELAPAWNA